jgi:hypothetical protein
MREAVVVASSRTALAKSFRGSFNLTRPEDLAAHCIKDVLDKTPELAAKEIEDVVLGCAQPHGKVRILHGFPPCWRAIGHPFGMTGSRMVGTIANEMARQKRATGSSPCASEEGRARRPCSNALIETPDCWLVGVWVCANYILHWTSCGITFDGRAGFNGNSLSRPSCAGLVP